MSDQDNLTPRVFLVRHAKYQGKEVLTQIHSRIGETEWAKSGRYTGITDIDLTDAGAAQVSSTATSLVGNGKLIDPSRIIHVFVSPRVRAVKTFKILLPSSFDLIGAGKVNYTEDIAEWDYGDYEGLKSHEIRDLRKRRGLDREREWSIWSDGCEGGESSQQIADRIDKLIAQIKQIQRPYMRGEKPADILLVAHGLILRCFVKRWLGFSIEGAISMMLAPGAVAVLSYKNNDTEEPAIHVGLALP